MSTKQVHATNEDGVPVYPMKNTTTVEAVMQSYQESKAEFVSLLHVGTDGWIKSLDFTPFSKDHLRDILTSGERADGSSLFEGTLGTQSSDICLRPRLSTAFIHPFTDDDEPKGICVLCDHLNKEGTPLDQSPSTILQKAQARVTTECSADGKLELYALGEVEYFLGRQVRKEECSKTLLIGNMDKTEKGYHSTSPFLFGTKLRRRAMEILTRAGYHAKYGHGEVGFIPAKEQGDLEWEQHEIEMSLMPLQQAADAVLLCQWILRNLASQEGYLVTFDPMISADHAGNGLHFHMSATKEGIHLHHYKDGVIRHQNHPVEEHKNLHRETQALIAGLCLCGGSLMAWGNRDATKSFLRLSEGHETPTEFQWDFFNRKALVRLPIQSQTAQGDIRTPATVEFRLGDGSAHPHLLLAGIAQAFCHAYLMDDTTLMEVVDHCRVHLGKSLDVLVDVPRNQNDIAAVLGAQSQIYAAGNVFHPSFIEKFLAHLLPYHDDEKEEKEEEKDPSSVGEELSNIMIQEPKHKIHDHHHRHKHSTKSK